MDKRLYKHKHRKPRSNNNSRRQIWQLATVGTVALYSSVVHISQSQFPNFPIRNFFSLISQFEQATSQQWELGRSTRRQMNNSNIFPNFPIQFTIPISSTSNNRIKLKHIKVLNERKQIDSSTLTVAGKSKLAVACESVRD